MNLNRLYDLIMDLQGELEDRVSGDEHDWYNDVKALAATYELQDYLAHRVEKEKR